MGRAASLLVCVCLAACGRPPLRVAQSGSTVVIDAQTAGEYPSDIARLRLTDAATHRVLWDVRGRNDAQIGKIVLRAGDNPAAIADVRHGEYQVDVPAGARTFALTAGKTYAIELWGRDASAWSRREADFTLPAH